MPRFDADRMIALLQLQASLRYEKLDKLNLLILNNLRREVSLEIKKMTRASIRAEENDNGDQHNPE